MRISDWSSDVCSSDLPFQHPTGDFAAISSHAERLQRPPRFRSRPANLFLYRRVSHHGLTKGRQQFATGVIASAFDPFRHVRSEEHTSELHSLMRISYAVFCLKQKTNTNTRQQQSINILVR